MSRATEHPVIVSCRCTSQPRLPPIFVFRSATVSRSSLEGRFSIVASNRSACILTMAISSWKKWKNRTSACARTMKNKKTSRPLHQSILSLETSVPVPSSESFKEEEAARGEAAGNDSSLFEVVNCFGQKFTTAPVPPTSPPDSDI